jgi:hypothetical protein
MTGSRLPGCEVDEVDANDALRIGRQVSSNRGGQAAEYDHVVWEPGTWQRAATSVRDEGSVSH